MRPYTEILFSIIFLLSLLGGLHVGDSIDQLLTNGSARDLIGIVVSVIHFANQLINAVAIDTAVNSGLSGGNHLFTGSSQRRNFFLGGLGHILALVDVQTESVTAASLCQSTHLCLVGIGRGDLVGRDRLVTMVHDRVVFDVFDSVDRHADLDPTSFTVVEPEARGLRNFGLHAGYRSVFGYGFGRCHDGVIRALILAVRRIRMYFFDFRPCGRPADVTEAVFLSYLVVQVLVVQGLKIVPLNLRI